MLHAHSLPPSLASRELTIGDSVGGYTWLLREVNERHVMAMSQQFGVPDSIARILSGRGIEPETVERYLKPTLRESLPDPSVLKDMDVAANRLADAVEKGEMVGIFGDYDVDGATSSALLYRFLQALGVSARIHIPDRITEGYGPNSKALLALGDMGCTLIATLDCGTVAFQPIEEATRAGLELIVVDHHMGEIQKPAALAVVNPNRFDEDPAHGLGNLCAAGVTFLLLIATTRTLRLRGFLKERKEPDLLGLLDLVALGTVCDVMTLTGLNRALVAQGLKVMAQRRNVGLAALMNVARLDARPEVYHAGFVLGPRINAGGRVGEASLGAKLLTTDHPDEAMVMAGRLHQFNEERKAIETAVLDHAKAMVDGLNELPPMLLLAGEGWHPGVIGIVAGRIKELYCRPTAIVALDNGIGKASARSITGVNLGAAIASARESGLLLAGGGHAMAAGFTVEASRIEELKAFLCERLASVVADLDGARPLMVDGVLSIGGANPELCRAISKAGPFGTGNPQPRFVFPDLRLVACDIVGTGHVRCVFVDGSPVSTSKARLKGVAFRAADQELGVTLLRSVGRTFHVAGSLSLNCWQGNESAEICIDDIAWPEYGDSLMTADSTFVNT